jgi:Kunitz/Bovine pancreatic trypsin inhibitor domain/Spondin-like TSP1 domain
MILTISLGPSSARAVGVCPVGTVSCGGACVPEVDNCGGCGVSCDDGNLLTVDACESGVRCIHTPPARQTCQACDVSTSTTDGDVLEIGREQSTFDGANTTFTYRACALNTEFTIDSWMLALSDKCCERLVSVVGGSSTKPTCVYDPDTGLRGVKFIVPPGNTTACDATSDVCGAGLGIDTFEITLAGRVPSGCVLYGASLAGTTRRGVDTVGQIVGPACEDYCDPRTLFDANGDTCVDLIDASLFLNTFTGPCLQPIDCLVSGFGQFSACSAACGSGTSCRTRVVMQEPANGGAVCPPLEECIECNVQPCPIDCAVGDWSAFSACSADCGSGTSCRTRVITQPPANGGTACPQLEECRECNAQPCPVDCVVSGWGPFAACSATCGGGTSCRSRFVLQEPTNGGLACPPLEDCQECNTQVCDVDCAVGPWSDFSACSAACDGGTSCRTRTVTQQPSGNGLLCPALQDCKSCNTQPCDICLLPVDVGPCDAVIPRWFFNTTTGMCEQFTWGGCGGNGNNFSSLDLCVGLCGTP